MNHNWTIEIISDMPSLHTYRDDRRDISLNIKCHNCGFYVNGKGDFLSVKDAKNWANGLPKSFEAENCNEHIMKQILK